MKSRSTAIAISAAVLLSVSAHGDDINCQTEYGDVELDGDVNIAAPCTFRGTTVEGNVKLFSGGSLIAIGAEIDGNIHADTADFIDLQNTEVEGNVKLDDMVGDVSYVRDSTIAGKLTVEKNRSRLELLRNFIDNDLEAIKNTGGVLISDNVIAGNLNCKGNNPEPEGDNNRVTGSKKGQCLRLKSAEGTQEPGGEGDGGTGGTGGTGDTGGTGGTGGTDAPPLEINTGTGGGASSGPLFIAILLVGCLNRFRRRSR